MEDGAWKISLMLWVKVYTQEPPFGKSICPEETEIKTESVNIWKMNVTLWAKVCLHCRAPVA